MNSTEVALERAPLGGRRRSLSFTRSLSARRGQSSSVQSVLQERRRAPLAVCVPFGHPCWRQKAKSSSAAASLAGQRPTTTWVFLSLFIAPNHPLSQGVDMRFFRGKKIKIKCFAWEVVYSGRRFMAALCEPAVNAQRSWGLLWTPPPNLSDAWFAVGSSK